MRKSIPLHHINNIFNLLNKKDRRKLIIVMFGSIVMGILEIVGVSSIMPFISVASNPDIIHTNQYLRCIYTYLHFTSEKHFLIALGLLMFFFMVIRNVFSAILMYIQVRFSQGCRHNLSLDLFRYYLGQKYVFFLGKNSYEFSKNINSEIEQIINGTIMQMVNLLTYSIQMVLIGIFLFIINPVSTLLIFIFITFVYSLIFLSSKRKVNQLGKARFYLNTERNRIVNEAFWGIKQVKISGNEIIFLNEFKPISKRLSLNVASEEVIGVLPKYVLEIVGVSAIIFYIMYIILQSESGFSEAITSISVYAYAGYRLMPTMQQFFRSLTKIKYSSHGTESIIKEFAIKEHALPLPLPQSDTLPFTKKITLSNIIFTYPDKKQPAIKDISLEIKANSLVGFCGQTGSGKTTIVDIILGLLIPDSGTLAIDDVIITDHNRNLWQKNIGYVPQNIFLSNSSIKSNIAFGIPENQIDIEAVRRAAKMAQIDQFIEQELEDKYETKIGEQGICLSGGQRQRIGIARALYNNPSVLVMDEATSALDNKTETDVMNAIDNLAGKKTIILIAHRISTLKNCDVIFELSHGKLNRFGMYHELFDK